MSAPTLLVGLGGTGCKIVQKVSKLVTEEQRQKLALAMFDTDINELKEIQKENPFAKIIQTSTKQTVGAYLNQDAHAREGWFPVNAIINGKTLTEGAGQVRSISRLALDTVIRSGDKMEPLHEAIESLYKVEGDKSDQALRVVIVSSLAGGTGSGLILPVALYIKNHLATRYSMNANITRGFFILPEVFYEVIKGPAERDNLKANAYATLRELDAFLMKGDGTLHERYADTVKMQFPLPVTGGYEEYDVRPYDFCFLFDAQDTNGDKLNSFEQYLDHAANCIYAQSIGPMNKRSNSSEDNTIRRLAREKGRNRYAGAGVSTLVYPFEDVKKYIALQWTKKTVSDSWLMFDEDYKRQCRENTAREEKGLVVQKLDPYKAYVKAVDSYANNGVAFAQAIVNACYKKGNTSRDKKELCNLYHEAVKRKVYKDEEHVSFLVNDDEAIRSTADALGNGWDAYVDLYMSIEDYFESVTSHLDTDTFSVAYSMFRVPREYKHGNPADYDLEYYLTTTDGKFMHPNAIRYLLIKIYEKFQKQAQLVETDIEEKKGFIDGFEETHFDDPDTDDKEDVTSLKNRKVGLLSRLSNKPSSEQNQMKEDMISLLDSINEYKKLYVLREVYREGSKFITEMLESYNMFYSVLDTKVKGLDKRIEDIRTRYEKMSGTTTRYVCADSTCLDKLYSKKVYTGNDISIDPELARNIFYNMLDYTLLEEKPEGNWGFVKLFDEDILGCFESSLMKTYGDTIDIDILRAIETEAMLLHPEYAEVENPSVLVEEYVKDVISKIRELSRPFIERPLGKDKDPIYACTYSKELERIYADDPKHSDLIKGYLKNFGAVPDEEIDKHKIMFYQSFYGLRANDLGKFAPEEKSLTYQRSGGEYFKAYYELVDGIHPESHKSREISPHIDRWWHIVTKMPDLDDENQARQEYEINAAFFWAMIYGYIRQEERENNTVYFVLDKEKLGMEESRLIVSNGSACDRLYEVLDAIAIYPQLRNRIRELVDITVTKDTEKKLVIEESDIINRFNNFVVETPGVGYGDNEVPARSIFTLPFLMKKSCAPDRYYEDNVIQIVKVALDEIITQLQKFSSPKPLNSIYEVIDAQYRQYLEDMKVEANGSNFVYNDSLFVQTVTIISETIKNLGFKEKAEEIEREAKELGKRK